MRAVMDIIGFVFKTIIKVIIGCLWLALEMLKCILLLFGMVFKVFLLFVNAGTPC